jgi:2-dehydro-3-deoxyphosphooctonate aldolase (KDO 8-P synthase)
MAAMTKALGVIAPNSKVTVGEAVFSNAAPLALIAGPCQLESRGHAFDMAGALKELTQKLGIGFVYKTSFDKANRSSLGSTRGAGLEAALPVFADLRRELGVPVLTDVHTEEQCAILAKSSTSCRSRLSCRARPIS